MINRHRTERGCARKSDEKFAWDEQEEGRGCRARKQPRLTSPLPLCICHSCASGATSKARRLSGDRMPHRRKTCLKYGNLRKDWANPGLLRSSGKAYRRRCEHLWLWLVVILYYSSASYCRPRKYKNSYLCYTPFIITIIKKIFIYLFFPQTHRERFVRFSVVFVCIGLAWSPCMMQCVNFPWVKWKSCVLKSAYRIVPPPHEYGSGARWRAAGFCLWHCAKETAWALNTIGGSFVWPTILLCQIPLTVNQPSVHYTFFFFVNEVDCREVCFWLYNISTKHIYILFWMLEAGPQGGVW